MKEIKKGKGTVLTLMILSPTCTPVRWAAPPDGECIAQPVISIIEAVVWLTTWNLTNCVTLGNDQLG